MSPYVYNISGNEPLVPSKVASLKALGASGGLLAAYSSKPGKGKLLHPEDQGYHGLTPKAYQ